jgi:hypothetical protein
VEDSSGWSCQPDGAGGAGGTGGTDEDCRTTGCDGSLNCNRRDDGTWNCSVDCTATGCVIPQVCRYDVSKMRYGCVDSPPICAPVGTVSDCQATSCGCQCLEITEANDPICLEYPCWLDGAPSDITCNPARYPACRAPDTWGGTTECARL